MHAIRVFEHDPDLVATLKDVSRLVATRDGIAEPVTLIEGDVDLAGLDPDPASLGLLVLDGLLGRQVTLDHGVREWLELLGPGDLVRPRSEPAAGAVSLRAVSEWKVLERTRIALLDRRFALLTARWPEIHAALMDRLTDRTESLGFQLAVCQLRRVDVRILAVLWHMAERWGRVTPDGVVVPVRLTHELVAKVVGAHRPTVSAALKQLRCDGVLAVGVDRCWVLRGSPPNGIEDVEAQVAGEIIAGSWVDQRARAAR